MYRNRSYQARIQKADPGREYNVKGRCGVVYNFLEDAYEEVDGTGYVVTGLLGEMWPVGRGAVKKYGIAPEDITFEPVTVYTAELDTVYAAIMIPAGTEFTLEVNYGRKALLCGNRKGISHGEGDYVVTAAVLSGGIYRPDFEDSGRIVNGSIFERLYKPFAYK